MPSFATIAASSVTSDFALQQFEHANNAHARQAVTLQINTLEQVERVTGESISKSELGYAYTRLRMIEESAGLPEEDIVRWFGRGNGSSELVPTMSLQTSN